MKCVERKRWVVEGVWGGRLALAVVLLPLAVPFLLLGSAEHVLTQGLDQPSPWKPSKACR
ncbi:MAG: hypothetical protein H6Q33_176 [Deltaproteobacteria bacterium]|jgi:hypothetical protein|nr:hypothetical protein [Deltaproteobacteria bacterium]